MYIRAEEYCERVFDGTHDSPKPKDEGRLLITSKNILNQELNFKDAYLISPEEFDKVNKRSQIHQWDILFSMIGTVGSIYLERNSEINYCIKNMGVFSCGDKDKAEWLYYYLQSDEVKKRINAFMSGAVQKFVPLQFLRNLPVPEYDESKRNVAIVLSSIDKRIENLRAQNRVLEQTAKTIYDYTFLQCAGHQTTYNKTLNRNIPVDWEVKCLGDLVRVSKESLNPQNYPEKQFKHFSIPSFDDNGSYSLEYGKDIFSNKFVVNNNHVLISKLNPWKNRAVWCDENDDAIGSTEFVTLLPHKLEDKAFVFSIVKSDSFIEYCSDAATGTSHSHRRVSPDIMMKFPIAYDEKTVAKFNAQVTPLFKKQLVNTKQIEALTTQRNTLLPLLMTGQVEV